MHDVIILSVDTGGTFTDFVLFRQGKVQTHKVLSTPEAPEQAILQGMDDLGISPATIGLRIVHGTTVATNAALEGKGVRTAFISNKGFGDLLTIGRQARPELYNLTPDPIAPPVPEELCLEIDCRRDDNGNIVQPLSDQDLNQLLEQIDECSPKAVAICLLFSFLNDDEEKRVQHAIGDRFGDQIFVTRSSWVLPEYKEYERGITTWYNAYLGPLVEDYLARLKSSVAPAPLAIMQSSGKTVDALQASQRAVNLMLSGPAGGLAAIEHLGEQLGEKKLLSFDMGGTSTDVALIDGGIKLTTGNTVGNFPVSVPMVDMHTIGAGGGSIAYVDNSGMLHVGPESAGAKPGPACYGLGGSAATVTDANAVLGRLQPDNFLGGKMSLNQHAADQALDALAKAMNLTKPEAAQGVIDLANEHMLQALRLISEQRGHEPKDYVLCGFGGAGGLHICELAESLGMSKAIVPAMGGVLSALGMLVAPAGRELSRAQLGLLDEIDVLKLNTHFEELENLAAQELMEEGHSREQLRFMRSADCRYRGQSFFLNLTWNGSAQTTTDFHDEHKKVYGHNFDRPVELVNIRLSAQVCTDKLELKPTHKPTEELRHTAMRKIWLKGTLGEMCAEDVSIAISAEIPINKRIAGPLLVCEEASTTWVTPDWELNADQWGNLHLSKR